MAVAAEQRCTTHWQCRGSIVVVAVVVAKYAFLYAFFMCLIIATTIATITVFVIVTCSHIIIIGIIGMIGIIFIETRLTVTQSRCAAGHCHRRTGPAPEKAHIARNDGHLLLLLLSYYCYYYCNNFAFWCDFSTRF